VGCSGISYNKKTMFGSEFDEGGADDEAIPCATAAKAASSASNGRTWGAVMLLCGARHQPAPTPGSGVLLAGNVNEDNAHDWIQVSYIYIYITIYCI